MAGKILPPALQEVAWKRGVDKRLLEENQTGQLIVPQPWPAAPYGGSGPPSALWFIPVTAAAFDGSQASQPWVVQLDVVTHTAFKIDIPWTTDAGTSGEVRLQMTGAPNAPSAAKTLAVASSGVASFIWLHGWPPYVGSDIWISIEARRTAGANNVNIGFPQGGGIMVGPKGAAVTG